MSCRHGAVWEVLRRHTRVMWLRTMAVSIFCSETAGQDQRTIPHSKPSRIWPTSRTCLLGAKKTINKKQVMMQRVPSKTLRGPKAVTSHPFSIVPKIDPIPGFRVRRYALVEVRVRTAALSEACLPCSAQGVTLWGLLGYRDFVTKPALEGG